MLIDRHVNNIIINPSSDEEYSYPHRLFSKQMELFTIISSSPAGKKCPAVFSFFVGQRDREEKFTEYHSHGIKKKMIEDVDKEVKK